jgi:hypothetical protein
MREHAKYSESKQKREKQPGWDGMERAPLAPSRRRKHSFKAAFSFFLSFIRRDAPDDTRPHHHTLLLLFLHTMGKAVDPPKDGMDVDKAAPADGKDAAGAGAAPAPKTPAGPPPVPAVLAAAASLMDRAARTKDVRGAPNRALRLAAGARPRFDGPGLTAFVEGALPAGDGTRAALLDAVAQVRRMWAGWVVHVGGRWVGRPRPRVFLSARRGIGKKRARPIGQRVDFSVCARWPHRGQPPPQPSCASCLRGRRAAPG